MTNDRDGRVDFKNGDTPLWITLFQMQRLFECVLNERDTDACSLLGLFLSDNAKADNERSVAEEQRQKEIELKKINEDIE